MVWRLWACFTKLSDRKEYTLFFYTVILKIMAAKRIALLIITAKGSESWSDATEARVEELHRGQAKSWPVRSRNIMENDSETAEYRGLLLRPLSED